MFIIWGGSLNGGSPKPLVSVRNLSNSVLGYPYFRNLHMLSIKFEELSSFIRQKNVVLHLKAWSFPAKMRIRQQQQQVELER